MWAWLLGAYAVLLLLISGAAAAVALFVSESIRQQMGFKVLKLTLGVGTGSAGFAGVILLAVKAHESGLLP
ncbi:hypothetical protein [Kutzneria sp. 744]|uniref:hypothetical protein n=1 Tax=Kutzneria sp. (strain 744) TaxID=345341 RepID=UPI0004AD7658|nr:hypothetical protein [Kutzneria sp. 744]